MEDRCILIFQRDAPAENREGVEVRETHHEGHSRGATSEAGTAAQTHETHYENLWCAAKSAKKQSRGGSGCEVVAYVRNACIRRYVFQRDAPPETWRAEVRKIRQANLRGARGTSRHRRTNRGGCVCKRKNAYAILYAATLQWEAPAEHRGEETLNDDNLRGAMTGSRHRLR